MGTASDPGKSAPADVAPRNIDDRPPGRVVIDIPVDRIDLDPTHPRASFEARSLDRLGRSLLAHGQLQPILVRRGEVPGRYVLITGARRWRALAEIGKPTVQAYVLGDGHRVDIDPELPLAENLLREGLSPLELARGYRAVMDRNGWSANRLALALSVHRGTIGRALKRLATPAVAAVDPQPAPKLEAEPEPEPEQESDPPTGDSDDGQLILIPGGRIVVTLDRPGGLPELANALDSALRLVRSEIRRAARTGRKRPGSKRRPRRGNEEDHDGRGHPPDLEADADGHPDCQTWR
jgi:ParB/RepB/Spo0J family partition protein